MTTQKAEAWKRAALMTDRIRRAIRDRARTGRETDQEIAKDYSVPVDFVKHLATWQLSEDQ